MNYKVFCRLFAVYWGENGLKSAKSYETTAVDFMVINGISKL